MSRSLAYGVVGASGFGRTHADAVTNLPNATLVAGATTSDDSAAAFETAYDVAGYADYEAMFTDADLDAVSVCTPSGTHADVAKAAIDHGIHVLVEKPIDISIDRVDDLIETADRADVTLGGVYQRRFTPERWTARRWVADGRFGDVVLADAAVKCHRSQAYYDDGWHGTREFDGGVLLQQASHHVDLLQWLVGGIESVSARRDTLAHEMECEDVAVLTLGFENGGYGTFAATTGVRGGCDRVAINGTEGSFESGEFFLGEESIEPDLQAPPGGTGLPGQIADFVDAIQEDRDPLVDGREARKSIEVVLAAYASARLDREVRVDEIRGLPDAARP